MSDVVEALAWALQHVRWKIDCEGFSCQHCPSSVARLRDQEIIHAQDCPYAYALQVLSHASEERTHA